MSALGRLQPDDDLPPPGDHSPTLVSGRPPSCSLSPGDSPPTVVSRIQLPHSTLPGTALPL
ncbi:hypothetical protein L211DRAFT_657191 [Terfezia boudieri ATCC MYA-4762]|uniref:Uncharacterized protein n=1 Tax=Terfezia boudieri ATCC MYA-4762 TaxID=1051890 RepID=A0A3N4LVA3_9PEZI|nr:hypothetical protein L211DRAFT_657191 [Terfezia boudieri ATCC MYA-4762]